MKMTDDVVEVSGLIIKRVIMKIMKEPEAKDGLTPDQLNARVAQYIETAVNKALDMEQN
jgi:hypothetical protein